MGFIIKHKTQDLMMKQSINHIGLYVNNKISQNETIRRAVGVEKLSKLYKPTVEMSQEFYGESLMGRIIIFTVVTW